MKKSKKEGKNKRIPGLFIQKRNEEFQKVTWRMKMSKEEKKTKKLK